MTDFSWPVFYRLTLKNDKALPRYIIPGRRLRIQLTMVNELDMFRGEDVLAECPIPIRVTAIPIEDNSTIDQNGRVLNHHEIACEIQTRNVLVKPVIERNGQGAVVIDLAPSPILRHDEELMFILQIGISPSSRIFSHVIPVSTSPFVMVSPNSQYAKEQLKRTNPDDDDESTDNDDDVDVQIDVEALDNVLASGDGHKHGTKHIHGPNCSHNHGKHTHTHDHHHHEHKHNHEHDDIEDEDEIFDEDDEDYELFDDEDYDEDDYDEDGYDDEDDDETHNLVSESVLAVYIDDEDIYETTSKPFPYEIESNNEDNLNLAEMNGIYHAFICDPLLKTQLHPQLQLLVDQIDGNNNTPTTTNPESASTPSSTTTPSTTTITRPVQAPTKGLHVQGANLRRPKALPPSLAAKQQAQQQSQQQPENDTTTTSTNTTSTSTTNTNQLDEYKYPILGLKTNGTGADMIRNALKNPIYHFLDPLNGLFASATSSTTATLQFRQTIAMTTYAYVKVIQGLSIGGRIWDGSIYLMKVLQRLFSTMHTCLDGSRCLELGSGTGVFGIWWWQLVQQRTLSQLNQLCEKFNVKKYQVEAVMHLICNGDFKPVAKVFLGIGDDNDIKSKQNTIDDIDSDDNNNINNSSIFSITIPTNVYHVANIMKSYLPNQPTMLVTDQSKIMSLLEQNARFNTTSKFPLYNQRLIPGSLQINNNQSTQMTTICVLNQTRPDTQLPLPIVPVTGLHSLSCDWNNPLNKHIYKSCGVYIPSSTNILYTKPIKTLIQDAIQIELPTNITTEQIQFTTDFNNISDLSSDLYTDLRSTIAESYHHYESLENAIKTPNKQAITGLEELLLTPPTPTKSTTSSTTMSYQSLPGLDVIFAVECLYNDRYFNALKQTIVNIYHAHMFSFAQKLYLYQATKSASTIQPKLQLPVIVLSYRFRATHEEELIQKTFFYSLRQYGLYHTECSLYRLLGEDAIHNETSGPVNTISEQVLQRIKDRKERENAIRNALGELDIERQHNTRLAVIFYSPGVIKNDNNNDENVQILSPMPYLTPNAKFWYQLFQKL